MITLVLDDRESRLLRAVVATYLLAMDEAGNPVDMPGTEGDGFDCLAGIVRQICAGLEREDATKLTAGPQRSSKGA